MKLLIALVFLNVALATNLYTEVSKFTSYNHPDGRTCMIEFFLKYDTTYTISTNPQLWNGTQGTSWYYEVYMGNNPWAPERGDRDVSCAVFSDVTMNKLAC